MSLANRGFQCYCVVPQVTGRLTTFVIVKGGITLHGWCDDGNHSRHVFLAPTLYSRTTYIQYPASLVYSCALL